MQQKFHQRLNLFIFLVPLAIFLNSCGMDFKSVENFVKENQTNIKNYSDGLAQDIYDSCYSEAAKILEKTITDLEGVIEELEQFNIFIGIFAKLINIFSRISQVVAAGGGAVAIISSLVNDLIKLADPVVERGGLDSYIPGAI